MTGNELWAAPQRKGKYSKSLRPFSSKIFKAGILRFHFLTFSDWFLYHSMVCVSLTWHGLERRFLPITHCRLPAFSVFRSANVGKYDLLWMSKSVASPPFHALQARNFFHCQYAGKYHPTRNNLQPKSELGKELLMPSLKLCMELKTTFDLWIKGNPSITIYVYHYFVVHLRLKTFPFQQKRIWQCRKIYCSK